MRKYRSSFVMLLDIAIVIISYFFAILVYFDFSFTSVFLATGFFIDFLMIIVLYYAGFKMFKLDKSIWSKISIEEGIRIILANIVVTVIIISLKLLGVLTATPKSVIIIAFLIITLSQESVRFAYRVLRYISLDRSNIYDSSTRNYIIYGAGRAGNIILTEFMYGDSFKGNVVGFVDDNPLLKGKIIAGKPVLGTGENLNILVKLHNVDEILVAVPSTNVQTQKKIMERSFETGVEVKSVNSVENLLNGDPLKKVLKKVDIIDLLERKEIKLNNSGIEFSIVNKDILVTGAAGSIGSELVGQIVTYKPKSITLLDINENALYELQQDLLMKVRDKVVSSDIEINVYLASIRDMNSLDRIFEKHQFDSVYHAAAHKHVPLMETSPHEAIKNNILGTYNLIEIAKKHKVDKFLNVSTDKAVNPTNVMGATKRFNEMVLQSQDSTCHTKFMAVRFGNVLGSNGSVVPLFRKQIEVGGPVTVTHPDIVRYFMTIPEAVSLILESAAFANGGEIFVLDMGEPVKILDLAKKVISLSGFEVDKDIKIKFTGLRPGEKLFEELLMDEEGLETTENKLIHITKPIILDRQSIEDSVKRFMDLVDSHCSVDTVIETLEEVVPTFKHEPNGIAIVSNNRSEGR